MELPVSPFMLIVLMLAMPMEPIFQMEGVIAILAIFGV
jgi:hypothetical protein